MIETEDGQEIPLENFALVESKTVNTEMNPERDKMTPVVRVWDEIPNGRHTNFNDYPHARIVSVH